jgi:IS5 family transposase
MLRLAGGQAESLFDELLPVEVRELPQDLAVLDRLLADPRLLAPIEQAWAQTAQRHGRPTIPMTSLVRLMVVKQRTGWGYQTLSPPRGGGRWRSDTPCSTVIDGLRRSW